MLRLYGLRLMRPHPTSLPTRLSRPWSLRKPGRDDVCIIGEYHLLRTDTHLVENARQFVAELAVALRDRGAAREDVFARQGG